MYVSPLYCRALFTFNGVGLSSPNGSSQGGKDKAMKLKIRYENEIQTIELDAKATEEMWVSLSLEGEGLSQKEREELIQKEWNEQFNKEDYNNWHKFSRHRGYSKVVPDEETDEVDCSEPLMSEVRDPRIFCRQELEKDKQYDYEACCDRIRAAVKPAQADMLIAIILDGVTVAEYADLIGDTPNNVSHRYRRAINNLKKVF